MICGVLAPAEAGGTGVSPVVDDCFIKRLWWMIAL